MEKKIPFSFGEIKHRLLLDIRKFRFRKEKKEKENYKIIGDSLIIKCEFGCDSEEMLITHIGNGYVNIRTIKSVAVRIDKLIEILKEFEKRIVISELGE